MARIDDGFSTTIEFAADSDVQMWEKEITPPGISGGGANDTSTMRNSVWRTLAPKQLKTLTECSFVASYDPIIFSEIVALCQVNTLITITFADGATLAFYGWLDSVSPNAIVEGAQPTLNATIIPSNQDGNGTETAPVYTAA